MILLRWRAIADRTKLIALSQVSNVFRSVQDISRIVKIGRKNDVPVLIDAAQSAGHMDLSVKDLKCDYLAVPGHKGLLGPQGTGILILRDPEELRPTVLGGGAVEWVRGCEMNCSNRPPVLKRVSQHTGGHRPRAIRGIVSALGVANVEKHVEMLARIAAKKLAEIDNVTVYGPKRARRWFPRCRRA